MVAALGIRSEHGDGNDVEAVHAMCRDAVAAIRAGGGPVFLEFATYRWREHCGPNFDNDIGYRTENEFLAWRARDPISSHERRLLADGVVDGPAIAAIDARVDEEVTRAFEFAERSPFPDPADAFCDLYWGDR
jgi:pyruvate dehydrogenase E1 component alpha subunit